MSLEIALAVGGSLLSAYSNKRSADSAADAQNEATERAYEYDLKLHEMGEQQL